MDLGVNARLAQCLNSVLNVKALVGAFNQEKALVWGLLRDCEIFDYEVEWDEIIYIHCIVTTYMNMI